MRYNEDSFPTIFFLETLESSSHSIGKLCIWFSFIISISLEPAFTTSCFLFPLCFYVGMGTSLIASHILLGKVIHLIPYSIKSYFSSDNLSCLSSTFEWCSYDNIEVFTEFSEFLSARFGLELTIFSDIRVSSSTIYLSIGVVRCFCVTQKCDLCSLWTPVIDVRVGRKK